jgi:hypothetical protein
LLCSPARYVKHKSHHRPILKIRTRALVRLVRGNETLVEIARSYAVSHMTFSWLETQHAAEIV